MAMQKIVRYVFYFIFLVSALLFTVGCKKDKTPHVDPEPIPTAKKLVKIQESPEDIINFEYNSNGTLKKVNAIYGSLGLDNFTLTFTYNANKKIDEVVNTRGIRTKYYYADGLLQKTEKKSNEGTITWVRAFYYENKKLVRIVESIPYPSGNDFVLTPVFEVQYSYYAVHANDVREAVHFERNSDNGQMEKSLIYKYESYDSKVNPYSLLGEFAVGFFRHSGITNPSNEVLYDKDYNLEGSNENEYTYDNDGYPVTQSQKITRAGTIETKTIIYTYQ